MFDLSRHPYFTSYTDPKSGIVSYILTEKVAPLQRQFYFAQPSITEDGKYLWFLCFNPPARYMTLGVVSLDPDHPFIKNFPYAAPQGGNPCVTPEGDGVYFGVGNGVYKLDIEGKLTKLRIGDCGDGAGVFDYARVCHEYAGDISPVFVYIGIRRRGGKSACNG